VLVLSRTRGVTPAVLPSAGLLDGLQAAGALKTATFTAVGYGAQDRVTGGGTPFFTDQNPIPRRYAFSSFNSLGPATCGCRRIARLETVARVTAIRVVQTFCRLPGSSCSWRRR
jgi:hypothetical protein